MASCSAGLGRNLRAGVLRTSTPCSWCAMAGSSMSATLPGEDVAWGTPLGRVAYHAGLRHDLRSVTKSIISLLFGVAYDRAR